MEANELDQNDCSEETFFIPYSSDSESPFLNASDYSDGDTASEFKTPNCTDADHTGEHHFERGNADGLGEPLLASSSAPRLPPLSPPSTIDIILLFLCGIGCSLAYIATLSSLVYFMMQFGADSYVFLNLCVYVPLVPISIAQAIWDDEYDAIYRSSRTYTFRGVVGYGLSIVGTLLILRTTSARMVYFAATLQGIGGAVLLGMLNQLASILESCPSGAHLESTMGAAPTHPAKAKAALSSGIQASALVVLFISIHTGFGSCGTGGKLYEAFFTYIAVLETATLFIFIYLISRRPTVSSFMIHRDSSRMLLLDSQLQSSDNNSPVPFSMVSADPQPLSDPLAGEAEESDASFATAFSMLPSNSSEQSSLSIPQLWKATKPACVTMCVTLVPSFLVGSWFTHVHTAWMHLPQILFYVRIGSDFVGRLLTVPIPPRSLWCIRLVSYLRLLPVVLFFSMHTNMVGAVQFIVRKVLPMYGMHHGDGHDENSNDVPSETGKPTSRDVITIALVAIIALLSGYLVTACFQFAPQLLPAASRNAYATQQATLLNVAFSVAALGGLLSSFVLVVGLGV